mmetsp:Transcript_33384/g.61290  ORF Transcript_33384/g.61290 Transcript_33384/m.61290 type:complete len:203 (+) Transcript_33384:57-665(+)
MGQCCSCVKNGNSSETSDELLADEPIQQIHSIDEGMSAPSIVIANDLNNEVTGFGLALADVNVEQDRAYWEWQVKVGGNSGSATLMFGVSNKRNVKFFEILAESTIPPEKHGTKFMGAVSLNDGDVVGVAVQQSEIPMIQLYLNGLILDGGEITRFRGTVFPSVYVPSGSEISATFLYRDDQFIHGPPKPDLTPLMAERSLM